MSINTIVYMFSQGPCSSTPLEKPVKLEFEVYRSESWVDSEFVEVNNHSMFTPHPHSHLSIDDYKHKSLSSPSCSSRDLRCIFEAADQLFQIC